jgi:hypothetical protein
MLFLSHPTMEQQWSDILGVTILSLILLTTGDGRVASNH